MVEETFNPADHTVADVKDYLNVNPGKVSEVLEAEQARGDDARVTLVEYLEKLVESTPPAPDNSAGAPAVEVAPGAIVNAEVETVRIGGATYTIDPTKGYRHVAGAPRKG